MKEILLATTNPGKVSEYKAIFTQLGLPLLPLSLKEAGINERVKEDGSTFKENAIKKAEFYYGLSLLPTLAEDSGLEIDFLGGEPGIYSRRWSLSGISEREASDQELIDIALKKLRGVPFEKRRAGLRAVLALKTQDTLHTFEGVLRGFIMEKPIEKIIPGYPFRSIFYIPEKNRALGEMTLQEEAEIAHRKQALMKALPLLKRI